MLPGVQRDSGQWIEFIRVRSSAAALQPAIPEILERLEAIAHAQSVIATHCVAHAFYDGDLAVCLVWRESADPSRSREGLLIAQRLMEFGPVDHSVWLPAKGHAQSQLMEKQI